MNKTVLLLIVIILFSGCTEKQETLYVKQIIDGDTFILSDQTHIRLIGMNTPEKGEYYYQEAKDKLGELLLNKEIRLESDISSKDWYGRTLKYVYIDDLFINLYLVENGYARAYIIEPNVRYSSEIREAETRAKENKLGIWNAFK